ncbi:MAG: DMT family transporter [Phycisphaerae bacterium]|nr:DMT family transporter [Phycisphaerae bacterium]
MKDGVMTSDSHTRHATLKGFLCAMTATVLLCTNYVTAKYALSEPGAQGDGSGGFNSDTFSLVWTASAAVYSLVIVLLFREGRCLAVGRKAVVSVILLGVATAGGMLFGWAGLSRLDPSFSSFLLRFAAVLTILLGVGVLGEKVRLKEAIPIALMVVGGLLSSYGRWNVVGTGVILTLLACCCIATQFLIAKMNIGRITPNVLVFYRTAVGTAVIAIWVFAFGKVDFNVERSRWLVAFLGAFLGPSVGHVFLYLSLRYWDMSRTAIVRTSGPLFVLPMSFLFLSRLPTTAQLAGGCVILAGAFWLAWIHLRKKPAAQPHIQDGTLTEESRESQGNVE